MEMTLRLTEIPNDIQKQFVIKKKQKDESKCPVILTILVVVFLFFSE